MSAPFDEANLARDTRALLGPQTAGWQIGFVIYGVYLTQHVTYLRSEAYGRHARSVKLVIWLVFVLVTLYEVIAFADNFRWTVTTERDPQDIIIGTWVDFITSLLAGMVALVVQVFLSIRASVLIRNRTAQYLFLATMAVIIVASFTGSILTCATSFMYFNNTISNISINFNQSVALWLWCAAFVDVVISLSLLVTLRERTGGLDESTDSLLRRLIVVSLQTATYTSVLAAAGAVVSLVFKDSSPAFALLHFAFWTPLPPCYAVSLYTTLSTRRHLDEHLGTAVYALGGAASMRAGGRRHGPGARGEEVFDEGPIARRDLLSPDPTMMIDRRWTRNDSYGLYSPTLLAVPGVVAARQGGGGGGGGGTVQERRFSEKSADVGSEEVFVQPELDFDHP